MMRRRYPSLAFLTLALITLVVSGCTTPAPTAVSPRPSPTDTVVYDVPSAPASPSVERPTTAGPTGAPAPETRGPLPRTQLTIMHTNDSRGYIDPCG